MELIKMVEVDQFVIDFKQANAWFEPFHKHGRMVI